MLPRVRWTALCLAAIVMTLAATDARPQGHPPRHRIVFEVNVDGISRWTTILNNVENVQRAFAPEKCEIEVVAHGDGIGLILASNREHRARLETLAASGIVFAACENTMKRKAIKREDLMPFAVTVDAGVAEVVRKQEAGWSYIKGGG